ncbi:MAG: hypothetical protein J6B18_03085, partial [Bacteroidaceae bacterium]|nr:hypothetical protein [Bacteroidaceae bacterium]
SKHCQLMSHSLASRNLGCIRFACKQTFTRSFARAFAQWPVVNRPFRCDFNGVGFFLELPLQEIIRYTKSSVSEHNLLKNQFVHTKFLLNRLKQCRYVAVAPHCLLFIETFVIFA